MHVGIGQIILRLRHCRSLKDKRSIVQSLITKLRNAGWSAVEWETQENLKLSKIGISYAAANAGALEDPFYRVGQLLMGDFEVVAFDREILDRSFLRAEHTELPTDIRYDGDGE